ncbi:Putative signal transducing protein [Granulicella rosea]|uniref:Putative signal transducing protein n=1 Tax=Granulicella rosea TaxID=474952 RepID=A0A239JMR8_9BACT|nr:DUF2007 domain-containing protein [Granulicella rosea]SNT07191.1 Putative signal transducing protein [Granulicella rosea]
MSEIDEELVTVGKYLEPADAHMAKGLLDSAGIECFLQGEQANSLLASAFRVRLRVRHADEDAAKEMLAGEVSIGNQWEAANDDEA